METMRKYIFGAELRSSTEDREGVLGVYPRATCNEYQRWPHPSAGLSFPTYLLFVCPSFFL